MISINKLQQYPKSQPLLFLTRRTHLDFFQCHFPLQCLSLSLRRALDLARGSSLSLSLHEARAGELARSAAGCWRGPRRRVGRQHLGLGCRPELPTMAKEQGRHREPGLRRRRRREGLRCEPGRRRRYGAGMALQARPTAAAHRSSGSAGGAQEPSRGLPSDSWEMGCWSVFFYPQLLL